MAPDVVKDPAAARAIHGGETGRSASQSFRSFLKTETFYLAVVIAVILLGIVRTTESLHEEDRPGPQPVLRRELRGMEERLLTRVVPGSSRAAAFAKGVQLFQRYLLWAGGAVVLGLMFSRLLSKRGPSLPGALKAPWGLWDVLKVGALFAVVSLLFHAIFPLNPMRPFALAGDWVAEIFARVVLVGATAHVVVAERGGRLQDLGIRAGMPHGAAVGLLGFFAIQPFLWAVRAAEERWLPNAPIQDALQSMLWTRSAGMLAVATIVVLTVTPIAEEIFFRGFLQPALQQWTGRWLGIFLSAAFFAAVHMDLYAMPALLVLGVALAYVYDRTRSLAGPVLIHAAHNGMTMLAIFATRGLASAAGGGLH